MMPRKRYPPLPKVMHLPGGEVPVAVVPTKQIQLLADPGEILFGYFHEAERRIEILSTMSREAQWRTLWHEFMHAALQDSGLSNGLSHELEEALCDAVSSALMRTLYRS